MEKFKFTEEDLKALLENPTNVYLNKTAEEKYADFSKIDPFPEIPDALLNSADIVKYVLITGMIDNFCAKNLSEATYTCNFSGRYYYWDDKKVLYTNPDGDLTLLPNSITFLEIGQFFRIPMYIALRFNLKVSHVYKGLLLGTGPIVDPNFVGHLYIPLHNLTSNEYIIKKDAQLINVEFTKLSRNSVWNIRKGSNQEKIKRKLNFDIVSYKSKEIKQDRSFMKYVEKALEEDLFFRKDKNEMYIRSSIPETILQSKENIEKIENLVKIYNERSKEYDDLLKSSQEVIEKKVEKATNEFKTDEKFMRTFSVIAVIGLMLTAIGLFIAAKSYFDGARKITEIELQIKKQQKIIEQQREDFDKYKADSQMINMFKDHIQELENEKNNKKSP